MTRLEKLSRSRHGFTLIELMVSIGISVIVISLVFIVTNSILNQSRRSLDVLRIEKDLLKIENVLSKDLHGLFGLSGSCGFVRARFRDSCLGTEGWIDVENEGKPDFVQLESSDVFSFPFVFSKWGRGGVVLEFFVNSPFTVLNDPGGVYCVAYQLMRLGDAGLPKYYLTRSQVSAHQSFDEGYFFKGSLYESEESEIDAFWSKSVVRHPNCNHILCENVIDFGVKLYAAKAGGGWGVLFPSGSSDVVVKKPDLAVFEFRILTALGARLIAQFEQGKTHGDWSEIAEKHSKSYSLKVLLL